MPASDVTPRHIDFSDLPQDHSAKAIAERISASGVCANVFPRATVAVHGKDHTTNTMLSPDIALLSVDLEMDHDSLHVRDELLGATLAFSVVVTEEEDPCAFAEDTVDTEKAAATRGRIAAIARAIYVNSHRIFGYALVLMPERARLVRFDHSGIVFTELFSWRTSDDLATFLTRFDCMTAAERGCDTSVETIPSSSQEAQDAMDILSHSDVLPEGVIKSAVIPDDHHGDLSLVHVYDDDSKTCHRVVVHKPVNSSEFYIGRSTLGYYGVDLDEGAVVYVKDTWRINSRCAAPEAKTYRRLNQHKVSNLPGFYHGGDVPLDTPSLHHPTHSTTAQSTFVSDFVDGHPQHNRQHSATGNDSRRHIHHRLLFSRIGRPLNTFKSTLQLCTALRHAMQGHSEAYENAQILHRDISGGNVLIDKSGRGILIDWDMCVWRENVEEMERIGQPIGTWRYIAAELQIGLPPRPHLLRDDLESFVHVLFYHVFRYRPLFAADSPDQRRLLSSMSSVFEAASAQPNGRVYGGHHKGQYLCDRTSHFDARILRQQLRPESLYELLKGAREVFTQLYSEAPVIGNVGSKRIRTRREEELKKYEDALAIATKRVETSAHIISVFDLWIEQEHEWPSDDGAIDQLVPRSNVGCSRSSRKRSADPGVDACDSNKARRLDTARSASAGASARSQRL
ncbi:unnamed protein product [Peniophora sp. CBMAI 1063]|nr:unnamed protein product [Peniophora sp. CBMAI 1063]